MNTLQKNIGLSPAQEKLLMALNGLYLIDPNLREDIITTLPKLSDDQCTSLIPAIQASLKKQSEAFIQMAQENPELGEKLISTLKNVPRKIREAAELDADNEEAGEIDALEKQIQNL